MKTLLVINASARTSRSLTRGLSQIFTDSWLRVRPDDQIIHRDLAKDPPPHVTESWIAACFADPDMRTDEMKQELEWSDGAIAELEEADIIVLAVPMYNYGMPSALKAWFDQVIRIGKTFSFDLGRGDWPLEPIMTGKRLVVLSSRGEFGFAPGGIREAKNHLDPHISTCAHYIGVGAGMISSSFIEYQEFRDERHSHSRSKAEAEAAALAHGLAFS
jgi:FMN-dependent NADH-azoreductase